MDFKVESKPVGTGDIELTAPASVKASVKAAAWLDPAPSATARIIKKHMSEHFDHWDVELARIGDTREVNVELVVNGDVVDSKRVPADGTISAVEFQTRIDRSSWIALRILGSSHTNPIFIVVGGQAFSPSRASAEWSLSCIEQSWMLRIPTGFRRANSRDAPKRRVDHARKTFDACASI